MSKAMVISDGHDAVDVQGGCPPGVVIVETEDVDVVAHAVRKHEAKPIVAVFHGEPIGAHCSGQQHLHIGVDGFDPSVIVSDKINEWQVGNPEWEVAVLGFVSKFPIKDFSGIPADGFLEVINGGCAVQFVLPSAGRISGAGPPRHLKTHIAIVGIGDGQGIQVGNVFVVGMSKENTVLAP